MQNVADHVVSVRQQGVFPTLVGGNHAITIGATRGAASTVDGAMGYLTIDAHLDMSHDWAGEIYSSGCPTYRVCELPNVDPANVVVLGVHGWLNPASQVKAAKEHGVRWFGMEEIRRVGVERAIQEAIDIASDGVQGLYVSFDQDSIDASHFPGTGTPEPGGLTSGEALTIARHLGRARPVGFDVVELAPIYDLSGISTRLSCGIVMDFFMGMVGR